MFDSKSTSSHKHAGVAWEPASLALSALAVKDLDPVSPYAGRRRKLSQSTMAIKVGQGIEALKACVKDWSTVVNWRWEPLPPSDAAVVSARKEATDARRDVTALAAQLETKMKELSLARENITSLQVFAWPMFVGETFACIKSATRGRLCCTHGQACDYQRLPPFV